MMTAGRRCEVSNLRSNFLSNCERVPETAVELSTTGGRTDMCCPTGNTTGTREGDRGRTTAPTIYEPNTLPVTSLPPTPAKHGGTVEEKDEETIGEILEEIGEHCRVAPARSGVSKASHEERG